jgi:large subunit ribosomal protein L17
MRHNVKGRKLGRVTEHRQAMFRNQLASLVESGRIVTTLPKAKELRPLAERLVTKGKRGSVDARRQVQRWIPQRDLIKKLFDEVAPRFQEREGGYLRIFKLGPRPGDGAEMAVLQWVDYELEGAAAKPAGKGDKEEKGGKAAKAGAGAAKKPAKAGAKKGGAKKPATRKAASAEGDEPPAKKAPRGGKQAASRAPAAPKKRPAGRKAPSGG